ncbi:MAG TPA: helix-turn-helix domain-containing protein [Solirubrobacterales bacterium]|nr:helix-turn-helix domain-containing protein [Solirubrobacterales bacterium]
MDVTRVAAGEGRLAEEFTAILEPHLHDPLNHVLRRQILRALHADRGARSVTAILSALSPLPRREVNYHLQILQRCDFVTEETRLGLAGRECLYESTVSEDVQVRAVLRVTDLSDRELTESRKAQHSSRFLTMFRIPRPVRTLRLGLDVGRETE